MPILTAVYNILYHNARAAKAVKDMAANFS